MLDTVLSGLLLVHSLFVKTVVFSFNLSYFVGQLIVWSALATFTVLKNTFYALHTLLQILCEDCLVFLADVASKLSFFSEAVIITTDFTGQNIYRLVSVLNEGVNTFSRLCFSAINSINNFFCSIVYLILNGFILLKDSIILVGSTSWSVFTFLPYKAVTLKNCLVSLILLCYKETSSIVSNLQLYLYKTVYDVSAFITDIPQESIYGLCLSILLGWALLKYWQNIYPSCVRYLRCAVRQSHTTLLIAWNYLETFTLWLLTNQTNPVFHHTNHNQGAVQENADDAPAAFHLRSFRNDDTATLAEDEGKGLVESEDRLCVVCQDEERCTIILPCRHVCLCYDCCVTIKRTHGRCPICRHVVRRTMRVYI